jgi:hypothetical protein
MEQLVYVGYVLFLAAAPVIAQLRLGWRSLPICILAEAAAILLIFYWAADWAPWPSTERRAHEVVGYDLAYLIWLYIPGLAAFVGAAAAAMWVVVARIRARD